MPATQALQGFLPTGVKHSEGVRLGVCFRFLTAVKEVYFVALSSFSWRDIDVTFTDGMAALKHLVLSGRQRLPNQFSGRLTQASPPLKQCGPFQWISKLQLSVYSSQEAAKLVSLLLFPKASPKLSGAGCMHTRCCQFNGMDDAFSSQEECTPSFSLPLLQRLDLYRGLGPSDAGVFRIGRFPAIVTDVWLSVAFGSKFDYDVRVIGLTVSVPSARAKFPLGCS